MKPAPLALAVLLLLGAGTAGLWLFLSWEAPPVADVEDVAADRSPPADEPAPEFELEIPEEGLASGEVGSESTARAGISPSPAKEVVLAASPRPAAPVSGILRDAATQEPLPEFLLVFEQKGNRNVEVTTDEDGRFVTRESIAGGRIRIQPLDQRLRRPAPAAIVREHEVKDGAAPGIELAVPSGPTYRLALSPTSEVEASDLEARLRVVLEENRHMLSSDPVRAGNPPWVRFAPLPVPFERAEAIEVRSRDGLWTGEAAVSALVGVVPGLVEVRLEARAALQGVVTDADGSPIRGARIDLDETTLAGKQIQQSATTDENGRYSFRFLRAGSGVLSARSLRHAAQDALMLLAVKEVATRDISLVALPPAGAIRGLVRSETGTYTPKIQIVLGPPPGAGPGGRSFTPLPIWPHWEKVDGREVGKFEFPALPAGSYQITVRKDDWLKWEPQNLVVSAPTESAVFLIHDDLSLADFVVRARDADNGAPLGSFFATIDMANGPTRSQQWKGEAAVLWRFPLERRFRWRIDHEGHRPSFGDETDFSLQEIRDGRIVRIADVGLRPGWGDVFRVVQRGNGKPIEGAKIVLDGREAATTRADGTARVESTQKPKRVEIEWKSWRVAGAIDLRPRWKREDKQHIVVPMAPPPPPPKRKP